MQLEEKLLLFTTLVKIGFKEIEVGFPQPPKRNTKSCAPLIEDHYIP